MPTLKHNRANTVICYIFSCR